MPLFVDWKDITNLRSDTSDTCLKAAEAVAGAGVTGDLLIPITTRQNTLVSDKGTKTIPKFKYA